MSHVRSILIALLSGVAAGLVIGGIGSRIAMRMIADSVHQYPEFTFATLNVLLIGTILGLAGGLIFFPVRQLLPSSALVQGLVLAAVIFAVVSGPFFLRPPRPGDELNLNPGLGRLLFSVLFVAYSFAVPVLARSLDRTLPVEERYRTPMAIAALVLGMPGALGIGAMVAALVAP